MTKKFFDDNDLIDDSRFDYQSLLQNYRSSTKMLQTMFNRYESLIGFLELRPNTCYTAEEVLNKLFQIEREYPLRP